jgi:hypothetical protein
LGRFCHTKEILAANNLQIMDGPYDWSGTASKETVYNRLMWFYKGFKHYFDRKDFVDFAPYKMELLEGQTGNLENWHNAPHYVEKYNKKTNTYFIHDFFDNASFDDQFEAIKEKYMRRIKRTEKYLKQSSSVLFVYMNHLADQKRDLPLESEKVIRIMNKLRKKFPNKTIDLYMFDHDPSYTDGQYGREILDIGIVRYKSNHDDIFPADDPDPRHWISEWMAPKSVCSILEHIRLTNKHRII